MSAIILDTLAYAKKLRSAGFSDQQAETQAEALAEVVDRQLATRADMQAHEDNLRRDIELIQANLKRDLAEVRKDIEIIRAELKRDIDQSRAELKRDMEEMESA
ncbi:coiled-coil domain-containing protein [Methylomagnum sp.]